MGGEDFGRTSGHDSMTVSEALLMAARRLEAAGAGSPRLTAELLLGHVLGWNRSRLLTRLGEPLAPRAQELLSALVDRRASGEPLQYLTERQEFYGRTFLVTPEVLIPRPETELLVETGVRIGRGFGRGVFYADVGTGSGCIAVSLAAELPGAMGWAVDLSERALGVARENAGRHSVRERIGFVCGDMLECFAPAPVFDLILSNPPYVSGADYGMLPVEVRDHEPRLALFGGREGIEGYAALIPQAARRLRPGGSLLLELGAGQAEDVAGRAEREGLTVVKVHEDLQRIPRCLEARKLTGRKNGQNPDQRPVPFIRQS